MPLIEFTFIKKNTQAVTDPADIITIARVCRMSHRLPCEVNNVARD
jgi:hypothetical protein